MEKGNKWKEKHNARTKLRKNDIKAVRNKEKDINDKKKERKISKNK